MHNVLLIALKWKGSVKKGGGVELVTKSLKLCVPSEREREKGRGGKDLRYQLQFLPLKMKALLLLVLPWLSPANYIDNMGNLHFLYSEL